jgi:enoyl-CoA hydratase
MSHILYETLDRVAVITLDRPRQANAQDPALLVDLDAAFMRASDDDEVRVIVLKANGKHFSAGHDLNAALLDEEPFASIFADIPNHGLLKVYNWEAKHYLGYSRKWRDIPKPTIAAVQGACIAGGLMLAWPCDLIIAAEDARFSDPVVRMGIGGVEYHGHTWEFGARKAKEMLFTGAFIDAAEAQRLGMVNRVVPRDQLEQETLKLAAEIATMHPHALQMAKRAVNQTLDIQGQYSALQSVFDMHSLGHANAWAQCGRPNTAGLQEMQGHVASASPAYTQVKSKD